MNSIKKVCVIGSGVMGSAIAAQIANSRTTVLLLDIADEKSSDANSIVKSAIERLPQQRPAPLSHPDLIKYIKVGNLRDDIKLVKECDLIIEAIIEKLEIKHGLYNSLVPYLKEGAAIVSNTSTLPLVDLQKGLPKNARSRLFITHFFNPPRYMELLELVTNKNNDQQIVDIVASFMTKFLGKTIVTCNDTPGFIANRVGCFLLEMTVRKALDEKLDLVKIDQIFSKLFGFPSTGIFGLYDLIGHDVMGLISSSLLASLPKSDKYHKIYQENSILTKMQQQKMIGKKCGKGFYHINKSGSKKTKQVLNIDNFTYQDIIQNEIPASIEELFAAKDKYAKFCQQILTDFCRYVISLTPAVTEQPSNIDVAMKLGYNMKFGPFELLFEKLTTHLDLSKELGQNKQLKTTYKPAAGEDFTNSAKEVIKNDSARMLLFKNYYIFEICSKMNSLNKDVFYLLIDACRRAEENNKPLIIYPRRPNFSVGADLRFFKEKVVEKNFQEIEEFLILGQEAMMSLKYSKIPVISCGFGLALGGGCEILLHSDLVIGQQNLTAGLVELGVGLIPGWGGVKEMFIRHNDSKDKLYQNLNNIIHQTKSNSTDYFANDYGVNCEVNMNVNYILEQATSYDLKQIAIKEATSRNEPNIQLPTLDLMFELNMEDYTPLQIEVLEFMQRIIDMKVVSEQNLLDLEREKFLNLASTPLCLEKLQQFV